MSDHHDVSAEPMIPDRRKLLSALAVAGTAFLSYEDEILAEQLAKEAKNPDGVIDMKVDALSGASRTHTNWGKFADLKEKMTTATIKGIRISRMIMGGNLIGGWAHARDLLYASDLVKAYHTRDKVFATFKMGEACGINTFGGNHTHLGIVMDYWKNADGAIQFIADCSTIDQALHCIENGTTAVFLHGGVHDRLVRDGKFDEITAFLERLRKEDVPVGLAGHSIDTVKGCAAKGIEPDFWMKTIHHGNYWSRSQNADGKELKSAFDINPEETIAFMKTLKQPWIGYKVLAAGAIHPKDGFRYGFQAGADFLCVGMYDFQIVDDVNICMNILRADIKRERPWCQT